MSELDVAFNRRAFEALPETVFKQQYDAEDKPADIFTIKDMDYWIYYGVGSIVHDKGIHEEAIIVQLDDEHIVYHMLACYLEDNQITWSEF